MQPPPLGVTPDNLDQFNPFELMSMSLSSKPVEQLQKLQQAITSQIAANRAEFIDSCTAVDTYESKVHHGKAAVHQAVDDMLDWASCRFSTDEIGMSFQEILTELGKEGKAQADALEQRLLDCPKHQALRSRQNELNECLHTSRFKDVVISEALAAAQRRLAPAVK
eukprot:gene6535-6761_t